jgi:Cu/Ag efflux pump CusA
MSDEKESSSLLQKTNQLEQGQYSGELPKQTQQQMSYSGTVQQNQYPPQQQQYYQPNPYQQQYSGNMQPMYQQQQQFQPAPPMTFFLIFLIHVVVVKDVVSKVTQLNLTSSILCGCW